MIYFKFSGSTETQTNIYQFPEVRAVLVTSWVPEALHEPLCLPKGKWNRRQERDWCWGQALGKSQTGLISRQEQDLGSGFWNAWIRISFGHWRRGFAVVMTQLYSENDHGMESLAGQFRANCLVHSSLQVPSLTHCTSRFSSDFGLHFRPGQVLSISFCLLTPASGCAKLPWPSESASESRDWVGKSQPWPELVLVQLRAVHQWETRKARHSSIIDLNWW